MQSGSSAGFGIRLVLRYGGRPGVRRRGLRGRARRSPPASTAAPRSSRSAPARDDLRTVGVDHRRRRRRRRQRRARAVGRRASPACCASPTRRGTRDVTVTKADFAITPVSSRYGAKIFDDGGRRVGYLNLRTFISTADPRCAPPSPTSAAQGVTDLIVDFRYNGGGLVSIAELMGDLLGGNARPAACSATPPSGPKKRTRTTPASSRPAPQSIAPTQIAFIGTGGTASASELVINGFIPYLRANSALVGTNTYGKPVGQIALDRSRCDDRLRVVAFKTENADAPGRLLHRAGEQGRGELPGRRRHPAAAWRSARGLGQRRARLPRRPELHADRRVGRSRGRKRCAGGRCCRASGPTPPNATCPGCTESGRPDRLFWPQGCRMRKWRARTAARADRRKAMLTARHFVPTNAHPSIRT